MADTTTARRVAIVDAPVDVAALHAAVSAPGVGAISIFLGTVRDINEGRAVTGIDYDAYRPMAEAELERIVAETEARFPGVTLAVYHRVGTLGIGEISVAIAAAHRHRADAMDASRLVIETLKVRLPVWKLEHYADGDRQWVDPSGAPR